MRRPPRLNEEPCPGWDGLVEKETKTHSARRVSLDAGTVEALADHRQRMMDRAAMCRVAAAADAFVFSNAADGSESWFPDSVSRSFKRLCEKEGMRGVRLHDLRHFVATELLSAGVDVRTVAGRLGHRNAATTLNVYAHSASRPTGRRPTSWATYCGGVDRSGHTRPDPEGIRCRET